MPSKKSTYSASSAFSCTPCKRSFASTEALSNHCRAKHTISSTTRTSTATQKAVNVPGTIPIENVEFAAPVVVRQTPTAWEGSLASHFESALCISKPPPPMAGKPPSVAQADKYAKLGRYRAIEASKAQKRAETQSNARTTKQLPQYRSKNNSTGQEQSAPLTALASLCHTRTTLIANKYTFDTNRNKVINDITTLMRTSLPTPPHNSHSPRRGAILLNCSTIERITREIEIIRISAIDYFTREILIDAVIQPFQPVADWYISHSQIAREAKTSTTRIDAESTLRSWAEARTELWKCIDANTILVGHALRPSLTALRMQHTRIVDTSILVAEKLGRRVKWDWSVKVLCHQLLNLQIQDDGDNAGSNSITHAFAIRRLVERWITNPVEVSMWADRQQKEWFGRRRCARDREGGHLPNSDGWILELSTLTGRNPFCPD